MEVSGQLHASTGLDAVESNPGHPAGIVITILTELPRHIAIITVIISWANVLACKIHNFS
jgi:hypothetical protein